MNVLTFPAWQQGGGGDGKLTPGETSSAKKGELLKKEEIERKERTGNLLKGVRERDNSFERKLCIERN